MAERSILTPWFPQQEAQECSLCRDLTSSLGMEGRRVAGEVALSLVVRGRVAPLVDGVIRHLHVALAPSRISLLVPEPAGKWRVFASSELGETHDLMIDADRYPELLEVRRTGTPFVVRSVDGRPEFGPLRALLSAARIRALAALPVFRLGPTADPIVLKISLEQELDRHSESLILLAGHMLVHRLARLREADAAVQLGLPPAKGLLSNPAALLRLLPLPALVIEGDGRIVHANARALWLLRSRAPASREPTDVLGLQPERPWTGTQARWQATLQCGSTETEVLGWSNRLGDQRLLVLLEPHPAARLESSAGRMRDLLARKIEELEQANALLEDHSRRRVRFVSDAAHELKTPLAILRSYLEALGGDLADGLTAEQSQFLDAATDGARRLQHLVEKLLDVAALDGGHVPLRLTAVACQGVLDGVAAELAPLAERGGVELEVGTGSDVPVRADPEWLEQVVRNLAENGVKYTRPGGRVVMSATTQGESGVITVSDTGIGIPADSLPSIFEEFVRVPGTQSRDGAGIGLAIVRRLVLAMGGRVSAESSPGQGSAFRVELPLWTGGA
ncbi:MAG: sensor histidine kinase [Acidobacteriota bacterium]